MKVNLKTTNEAENAAATPACHQRGQRTVNGIVGNTRRGIVIDKTLDPDSNNPVANKPVSTALAALAGQLDGKQDKLTAGNNITIEGTTIAAVRPENMALYGDLVATDGEFTGGGSGGGAGGGSNNTLYPYNVHWNLYNESFELLIFKKEKLANRTIKTVDELKELLNYPNNTHLLVHGTVKPSSTSEKNALVSDFIVKKNPSFSLIVYYRT